MAFKLATSGPTASNPQDVFGAEAAIGIESDWRGTPEQGEPFKLATSGPTASKPQDVFGAEAAIGIESDWRGTPEQENRSFATATRSIQISAEVVSNVQNEGAEVKSSIPHIVFAVVTSRYWVQTGYATDDVRRVDSSSPESRGRQTQRPGSQDNERSQSPRNVTLMETK
jgi:hypothetical protein